MTFSPRLSDLLFAISSHHSYFDEQSSVVFSFFESFISPDRKQAFGLLLDSAGGLAHALFVFPHPSLWPFFLFVLLLIFFIHSLKWCPLAACSLLGPVWSIVVQKRFCLCKSAWHPHLNVSCCLFSICGVISRWKIFWLFLLFLFPDVMEDKPAFGDDIPVFYSMPSVSIVLNAVISNSVHIFHLNV